MKKITINGVELVKLDDLKFEIRSLRKLFPKKVDAYNDVVRAIFREEYAEAEEDWQKDAVIEMSGDFTVCKRVDGKPTYFCGWDNGEPIYSQSYKESMSFAYESMAEEVVNKLNSIDNDTWYYVDMCDAAYESSKKLLDAIFNSGE